MEGGATTQNTRFKALTNHLYLRIHLLKHHIFFKLENNLIAGHPLYKPSVGAITLLVDTNDGVILLPKGSEFSVTTR